MLGVRSWRVFEGYCSTGQSPQWAVVPMEGEEKECEKHGLPCACYNESCKCSTALSVDHLYRIPTRSGNKSEKY